MKIQSVQASSFKIWTTGKHGGRRKTVTEELLSSASVLLLLCRCLQLLLLLLLLLLRLDREGEEEADELSWNGGFSRRKKAERSQERKGKIAERRRKIHAWKRRRKGGVTCPSRGLSFNWKNSTLDPRSFS